LQDLLKTFYEFFTPQNQTSLLNDWKSQRWGFLTGGDVSGGATHPFLPGEISDKSKITVNVEFISPAEKINREIHESEAEMASLKSEIKSITELRTSEALIKELAKLPAIQKRIEELKNEVHEKLLKKAREYYGTGDFTKMTRKKI